MSPSSASISSSARAAHTDGAGPTPAMALPGPVLGSQQTASGCSIAVMGAGAVGGYYGALLAKAGHAVTLIGRSAMADAVRRRGLRIEGADFDWSVPVAADTDASAVAGAQWVLVAVKSSDTEAAGAALRPHLSPQATVVSLQNGVDNAFRLSTVLPDHAVLGAAVYVATEVVGPGHIRHHGRGDLVLGIGHGATELAHLLNAAGIPTTVSSALDAVLWRKLVINCAYNALSALTQQPYGELVQGPGVAQVMDTVVDECLAVALGLGIDLPTDLHAAVRSLAQSMPAQYSSTAQDLRKGKPTEIDHLNGLVVRQGQALGIPTPVNQVLWTLVKQRDLAGSHGKPEVQSSVRLGTARVPNRPDHEDRL